MKIFSGIMLLVTIFLMAAILVRIQMDAFLKGLVCGALFINGIWLLADGIKGLRK